MKIKQNFFLVVAFCISMSNLFSQWTTSGSDCYLTTTTNEVGIGLTAPTYKLHVIGTERVATGTGGTAGYVDLLAATGSNNPSSIEIGSGGTTVYSQIDFKGYNNLADDFEGRIVYSDGNGFYFYTAGNTTPKMIIKDNGSVGIATSPTAGYIFHVNGANSLFEYGSSDFVVVTGGPGGQIWLAGAGSSSNPKLMFTDDHDGSASIDGQILYKDGEGMNFASGGTTTRMRIKTDGKVVIGNTSTVTTPSGYLLYVEDGILTERVKVALCCSTEWSDFVFDPNYELLSLDSVEQFTKNNRHLPGMPSAEEVQADGIDVAKMDALLLKQIEELWLQLFLLKKENDQLKELLNK